MTQGPFQSKEGEKIILTFVQDELLPLVKEIRELAINASKLRVGFFNSFMRRKLSRLEDNYKITSIQFIQIYHKWSTPDILFKNLKMEPPVFMADYMQAQGAVMNHINESFRLLNYIDRILTEQSTASYNRMSIAIALFAIVISIGVFLFNL